MEKRSPSFVLTHQVPESEIDELNHVSNRVYLDWVLEAAERHSQAVGFDTAAYRKLGSVFVVKRHEIDYRRPALLGDELTITTWLEDWTALTSLRRTRICRGDGEELAKALTTWVFVSFDKGRPRRIPEIVRSAFLEKTPQQATRF